MNLNFARTIHDLDRDNSHSALVTFIAAAVLGTAWLAWLLFAHVAVYRATDRARLILGRNYEADAGVEGRIVAIRAKLGQKVHRGDVLLEIDSGSEERQLVEDRTRVAVIGPQIIRAQAAIEGEQQAQNASRLAVKASLAQAMARWQNAVHSSEISADIARRYRMAHEAVSRVAILKTLQEAENAKAQADALHLEISRIGKTAAMEDSDRTAELERLRQQHAQLIGDQQSASAEIQRLLYEIEKHHVRAPADGRVAGLAKIGIGQVVREGDMVATVVPYEDLQARADFEPASALGVIRPGQRAWLRLSGFPWTQYGSIRATVSSVASEPTPPLMGSPGENDGNPISFRDQKFIAVELKVDSNSAPLIPLQYGLPGSAEIEVERVTPATLIVRTLGGIVARPSQPYARHP